MKEEGAGAINTVPLGVPWQQQTGARMYCAEAHVFME